MVYGKVLLGTENGTKSNPKKSGVSSGPKTKFMDALTLWAMSPRPKDMEVTLWLAFGSMTVTQVEKTRQRSSNQLLENHQLTFELAAIFFLIKMLVIGRTTFSWNPRFVLLIGSFQVRSLCWEQVCLKNKFGGMTKLERFQFIKETRTEVNREKSWIWEANRKNNLA